MRLRLSFGLALAALLSPLCQGEVWAWFKFTNKTSKPVYVAFVHYVPGCEGGVPWEKKGWWRIEPGQTKTVQGEGITNRYSYFYAESDDRAWVWTSASPKTCLPQPAFTWCWTTCNNSPSTRTLGLRMSDAGNSSDHTVNLNPPSQSPPASAAPEADSTEDLGDPGKKSAVQVPVAKGDSANSSVEAASVVATADAGASEDVLNPADPMGTVDGAVRFEGQSEADDPMGTAKDTQATPKSAYDPGQKNAEDPMGSTGDAPPTADGVADDPMGTSQATPKAAYDPGQKNAEDPMGSTGDAPPTADGVADDPMGHAQELYPVDPKTQTTATPRQTDQPQPPAAGGAMQASPHPYVVTQPDGTKVALRLYGNRRLNWQADINGYPVFRNRNGVYVYAVVDAQGRLKPTERVVGKVDAAAAGIPKARPTAPPETPAETPRSVEPKGAAPADPMGETPAAGAPGQGKSAEQIPMA